MVGRKIAINAVISTGARIINLALSLVIIGFITRYLGQAGFGEYATILAFLFFFSVLSDLGLYSICVRDISRPNADESRIASNAFTMRFVFGLLIFSLAPLVVSFFPYSAQVKVGVLIGAAGFWALSCNAILISVFQKYLRMEKVAIAEVLSRLTQFILVMIFIRQDLGFLWIVSALVFGAFVHLLTNFIFVQRYVSLSLKFDFSLWSDLLKKSIPLGLASIFTMVYFKLDTIMLSVMKGPVEVGIYSLAYKVLESLIFFPAMLVGLVMPLLSKYAFSERKKFERIGQQTMDVLLVFVIPLVIGTFFLSRDVVVLIGGDKFLTSAGVLNILIIATGIIFLETLFSNTIISLEKQKVLTGIYFVGLVINLVTNWIFIPRYSYYGAAGTTLLTELTVAILMIVILYQSFKISYSFRTVYKNILAGLGMALFLYLLPGLNVFVLVIASILIYFGLLSLVGGFSVKKILSLKNA